MRPAEPSGSSDGFRKMDRKTFTLAPEIVAEYGRRAQVYKDALRDWVRRGAASDRAAARRGGRAHTRRRATRMRARTLASRWVGTSRRADAAAEAQATVFARAVRSWPENWSIRRQALSYESPEAPGGPQFWSAVDALGPWPYYRPVRMRG